MISEKITARKNRTGYKTGKRCPVCHEGYLWRTRSGRIVHSQGRDAVGNPRIYKECKEVQKV